VALRYAWYVPYMTAFPWVVLLYLHMYSKVQASMPACTACCSASKSNLTPRSAATLQMESIASLSAGDGSRLLERSYKA